MCSTADSCWPSSNIFRKAATKAPPAGAAHADITGGSSSKTFSPLHILRHCNNEAPRMITGECNIISREPSERDIWVASSRVCKPVGLKRSDTLEATWIRPALLMPDCL
ncbi:hypothetical protein BCR37DRAFT_377827 [Protomyces lactucae-debilis]|uniref:Uncharacterized protein n=1 Tax=Protomyces lactucae-debilis TaxID=2754530 RepID=A0A1Y2FNK0_PROLT|nr:uncharacterized protein BCR37DRAFT_377827 [Protomyces lactucae-debilis]ORY84914.1 hypothetical protein BCR37DRAFT_377827 [Protomyces lactucae-debilis]